MEAHLLRLFPLQIDSFAGKLNRMLQEHAAVLELLCGQYCLREQVNGFARSRDFVETVREVAAVAGVAAAPGAAYEPPLAAYSSLSEPQVFQM